MSKIPMLSIGPRGQKPRVRRLVRDEATSLPVTVTEDPDRFARVLRQMRSRSQLSIRELAERLGCTQGSLTQYFYRKRGREGSGTLRWFLRFASACGCRVYVTYPSAEDARGLAQNPTVKAVMYELGPESSRASDAR
jgi:transcriptional regulator with XRE-family HTH domain